MSGVSNSERRKSGRVGGDIRSTFVMLAGSAWNCGRSDATIDSALYADEAEWPDCWNLTVGY